jgi:hypothetical protein
MTHGNSELVLVGCRKIQARGQVRLPDISNNVGSVKSFLNVLLRSLRRVVFLVPL